MAKKRAAAGERAAAKSLSRSFDSAGGKGESNVKKMLAGMSKRAPMKKSKVQKLTKGRKFARSSGGG
jgi:hypothetical protein